MYIVRLVSSLQYSFVNELFIFCQMSNADNAVTPIPTMSKLIALLQATWPTLTTDQIYERIDLELLDCAAAENTMTTVGTEDLGHVA